MRRWRPIKLYWPVATFALPGEWAREFRLSFVFFEFHWFALDHLIAPAVRMRSKSLRWGLL